MTEARSKQAEVDNFIKSKAGITDELAADIRTFVNGDNSQGKEVNIGEVYALMSHSLQVAVAECISRETWVYFLLPIDGHQTLSRCMKVCVRVRERGDFILSFESIFDLRQGS